MTRNVSERNPLTWQHRIDAMTIDQLRAEREAQLSVLATNVSDSGATVLNRMLDYIDQTIEGFN